MKLFLFIQLCCITLILNAQYPNLQFKHLTTDNGLSQGVVNNILTDKKGFTWFTSHDGINRFDGTNCLSNNQIGPGMDGIAFTSGIAEDKNGDIWIGSAEALIHYSYRSNRFEKLKIIIANTDLLKNAITSYRPIAVSENNLLIEGGGDFLLVYNMVSRQANYLASPQNIPDNDINGMILPPFAKGFIHNLMTVKKIKGNCYFFRPVAYKTGQYKWQVNKLVNKEFYKYYTNLCLTQNDSILVILTEGGGILQYNFNNNKLEKLAQLHLQGKNSKFYIDADQRLWICTTKDGLYVYDLIKKEVTRNYRHNQASSVSLMSNQIQCAGVSNNILWVSSWGKGVDYCRFSNNGFSHHFTNENASANKTNNFIRDMVEGADGSFYCNTQFGGVVKLNKALEYVTTLSTAYSNTLGIDQTKTNLFFGQNILNKYNLLSNTIVRIHQPAPACLDCQDYYYFSPLKNGNIIAAALAGVWQVDNKNNISQLPGLNDDGMEQSIFAYEDRNGNIYKSSRPFGLQVFRFMNNRYKSIYTFPEKFTAKHIYQENDTAAWIASTNGLYVFNPEKLKIVKHYTVADGLPNNVVYAIAPDDYGRLWFSTNKGISMFTKTTGIFKNYSGISGMQGNEYNSHTVVTATDGRIIFGGVNGLTAIRPWEVKPDSIVPIIHINAIKTDSSINPFQFEEGGNNTLHLAAGSNTLELGFVGIDYNNPGACLLKYKLTGYEDDWVITRNPGYARYVQLKQGEYTFEIKAANADGVWSSEVKKLHVKIDAAWWQQLWVKWVAGFLLVATIILAIRLYVKQKLYRQRVQMEKQQAIATERERIITDLHDDVGATLSSMHIYGDLANSVWDTQPHESQKMIEKISAISKELMSRMGDIIWSMKPSGEEKHSFTARLKNYGNELLSPKNIVCEFNIDETLTKQINHPEVRKNILLIAKEAMNNIAKYSEASKATVSLLKHDQRIMLTIRDNGKGYKISPFISSTAKTHNGNGMQNIQDRCKQLNGILNIESLDGLGVVIECNFPMTIISHSL